MAELAHSTLARFAPRRKVLLWGSLLVLAELLAVLLYLRLAPVTPVYFRYYVYPFIWINVGLWAVLTTSAPVAPRKRKQWATVAATGYFLLLAWVGGLLQPGFLLTGEVPTMIFQVSLLDIPPGWGPALMYDTGVVRLFFMPYQVVGYLALAYLVYVTILDTVGSAVGGLLGLLSCVSCTWPVLAAIVTGVAGSSSGIAAVAFSQSYDLSTVVFVVTVALLYWRPTIR